VKNTPHTFILSAIQRNKTERLSIGISSTIKMAQSGLNLFNKPYINALRVVERLSSIKPNYIKTKPTLCKDQFVKINPMKESV
jgi:hypothetical protein